MRRGKSLIAGLLVLGLASAAWAGDTPILVIETRTGWYGYGVIVDHTIVYCGESFFTIPLCPGEIGLLIVPVLVFLICATLAGKSILATWSVSTKGLGA